jgi:hypothetical protein
MIRSDEGCWQQIESYISEHSEAVFRHGFYPARMKKRYPEFYHREDATDD